MRNLQADRLAEGVIARQARAIARAISLIENRAPGSEALLSALYPATGQAMTIGVTGPPGAGKSTLVDRLVAVIRGSGRSVGVIAVDPASPFSGGAILGDRLRMEDCDPEVFIRSMSTRGHLGGIALATEAAVAVLDAAGYAVVIVETVGVGQSEIEVAQLADTTVLVQPPGLGDGVQAVKAGIMEIPDLFVINKADLPGARQAAKAIASYLELAAPEAGRWTPPVLLATASSSQESGLEAVWEAITRHWEFLGTGERLRASRRARAEALLWREAERALAERLHDTIGPEAGQALAEGIAARRLAPHEAAAQLVEDFLRRRASI